MTGERNLARLVAGMNPQLDPVQYVYATIASGLAVSPVPLMRLAEDEGDTVILSRTAAAEMGLATDRIFRRITLTVHSDLEAVGLTGAFATCLAEHGISANVVAGYFHDHIFIPNADAEAAMAALTKLAKTAVKAINAG